MQHRLFRRHFPVVRGKSVPEDENGGLYNIVSRFAVIGGSDGSRPVHDTGHDADDSDAG